MKNEKVLVRRETIKTVIEILSEFINMTDKYLEDFSIGDYTLEKIQELNEILENEQ